MTRRTPPRKGRAPRSREVPAADAEAGRREFLTGALGGAAAVALVGGGCGSSDSAADAGSALDCGPMSVDPPVMAAQTPYTTDPGPATSFIHMDQSNTLDWLAINGPTNQLEANLPVAALDMLRASGELYLGYPISQLDHALQAATRASRANASDELVLAALLHDMGQIFTPAGHAELGAAVLRNYVSEDVYRVVRHHTEFEWQHYGQHIDRPTDLRQRYADQTWYADAERFTDEWDAVSFEPDYDAMPLEEFEPLVVDILGRDLGTLGAISEKTFDDCI